MKAIPIEHDGTGAVTRRANLLEDYTAISLEQCQREAHSRYGTAIANGNPIPTATWNTRTLDPANNADDKKAFYDQVHSQVVAEWVKNVLTPKDYEKLLRRKKDFAFHNASSGVEAYDGPTMLHIIFTIVEPNTVVGVDTFRSKLKKLRLHQVNNDVGQACDEIERLYKAITDKGKDCESIQRYTLDTLKSGPNDAFNRFIARYSDDIESQTGPYKDMTYDAIIKASRVKWNNMVEKGEDKNLNPQDAKILALTTQVKELKKEMAANPSSNLAAATADQKNSDLDTTVFPGRFPIQKWRGKKDGDTKVVNGRTYYWCPHHKKDGCYDGLYVTTHKAEDHFTYVQGRRNGGGASNGGNGGGASNGGNGGGASNGTQSAGGANTKLQLNEKLKSVLSTKLMLNDEDVEAICKEIHQEN